MSFAEIEKNHRCVAAESLGESQWRPRHPQGGTGALGGQFVRPRLPVLRLKTGTAVHGHPKSDFSSSRRGTNDGRWNAASPNEKPVGAGVMSPLPRGFLQASSKRLVPNKKKPQEIYSQGFSGD